MPDKAIEWEKNKIQSNAFNVEEEIKNVEEHGKQLEALYQSCTYEENKNSIARAIDENRTRLDTLKATQMRNDKRLTEIAKFKEIEKFDKDIQDAL
jgi:hypothetical protein